MSETGRPGCRAHGTDVTHRIPQTTRSAVPQTTWSRSALGGPEDLPFDLRQKRVLKFSSAIDAPERASERRRLQKDLKSSLALVLSVSRSVEADIEARMTHKRLPTSTGEIHHYELDVCVKNISRKRIDDWEIDVEFPTPLMEPNIFVGTKVGDRSNAETSIFRVQGRELRKSLRPGEESCAARL
jgi:hypothetical protein